MVSVCQFPAPTPEKGEKENYTAVFNSRTASSPRTTPEGTRGNSLSGRPSFQKPREIQFRPITCQRERGKKKSFSQSWANFFFSTFLSERRSRSGEYPTWGSNDRFNFGTLLRLRFFFCIFHHDACARWGTGGRERTRRLSLERNPNKFSVASQTASG